MSTLVLNPNCSVYIRLNYDILYADFDTRTLSLYDVNTDAYYEQELSYSENGVLVFYINASSVRATVKMNLYDRTVTITPENELLYFEQELAQQYAI